MKKLFITILILAAFACSAQQADTVQLTKWQFEQLVELEKVIKQNQEKYNLMLITLMESNSIIADRVKQVKIEGGKLIVVVQ